ncbi:hypothetical protein, partial [Bacillus paralicheniformis]
PNTAVDVSQIKTVTLPTDEEEILEHLKGADRV